MEENWFDFAKRLNNFRFSDNFQSDIESIIEEDKGFYVSLFTFKQALVSIIETTKFESESDLVVFVLDLCYKELIGQFPYSEILNDTSCNNHFYEAFIFLTLSQFINASKKSKSKKYKDFIKDHIDDSCNNQKNSDSELSDMPKDFENESMALRQYKSRLNKQRETAYPMNEWHGMPESSEHEWTLYFKNDPTIKKIKNLYSELEKAEKLIQDNKFDDKRTIESLFEKQIRKVKKLKLQEVMELWDRGINHIEKDYQYYGMNLYRFEKLLKYFYLTTEIDLCTKGLDYHNQSVIINRFEEFDSTKLVFPLLIDDLLWADIDKYMAYLHFYEFIKEYGILSCLLIFDNLIDNGLLNDQWQATFCEIINSKADLLLYKPRKKIEVNEETQSALESILLYPVINKIRLNGYYINSDDGSVVKLV